MFKDHFLTYLTMLNKMKHHVIPSLSSSSSLATPINIDVCT